MGHTGIVYIKYPVQLMKLNKQEKQENHLVCQPVQPLADKIFCQDAFG